MPFNQYTASNLSLVKSANGMTELYIPLWVYSSGTVSTTLTASTFNMLTKGSTSVTSGSTVPTSNAVKLHSLSSNWSTSQKFALEVSIYISSAASVGVQLVDITAGSSVIGASVASTSTTATLLRSGQFTLIPGHQYGVTLYTTNASYTAYLTKAHLVALLS